MTCGIIRAMNGVLNVMGGENVIPTILLHQQKLMLNQVKYTQ